MSDDPELLRLVRDALAHLYDFAYLQRHALAERLASPQATASRTRGQELRRILLDAIEALNPGPGIPIRAAERRAYAILFGLYVEGRPQPEVASQLAIGTRQLRRDRAAALQALTGFLRDRYLRSPAAGGSRSAPEHLRQESERLAWEREPVDVHELVAGLLPLLAAVAGEHGVQLVSRVEPGLPPPNTNRTLLRQVLIGLAGQALADPGVTRLSLAATRREAAIGVGLRLRRQAGSEAAAASALLPRPGAAGTLVEALGARLVHGKQAGEEELWVLLPLQDDTLVLIVDDNQELFALFERYVAGRPYHLIHAQSAEQALELARSARPHIITIDLMMPNRDGWELLQALRAEPATAPIPTIVCSVLEEPQLARALGAQGYLKKPVGQADLLVALEAVRAQGWAAAASREAPAGC